MDQNAQPPLQTPPPPVQPVPQPSVKLSPPQKKSYLFRITIVLLLLGIASLLGYRYIRLTTAPKNFDECISAKDSRIQKNYPQTCVTWNGVRFTQPVVLTTPAPPTQITRVATLSNGTKSGWKKYENSRFSIELPDDWFIVGNTKFSNLTGNGLRFTDSLLEQHGGDPYQNSISITLSDTYGKYKWSDITTKDTFFDLQSNIWQTIMRETGGGGIWKINFESTRLSDQDAVKKIGIITEVIEGFAATDTDYFIPEESNQSSLQMWDIEYQLPLQDSNLTERKHLIDQILSTFKFTQ